MLIEERLPIPSSLLRLVERGVWPRTSNDCMSQNLEPVIPDASIRAWAPEETRVYFYTIPKFCIQTLIDNGDSFWLNALQAPQELDFRLSAAIGDFGIGSDAPIILDYRDCIDIPTVLRLRWSSGGNHWIRVADTFDAFVSMTGLDSAPERFR